LTDLGLITDLRDDRLPGEPLLQKVMSRGKIVSRMPSLPEIRKRFLDEFTKLDERYRAIEGRGPFFPVSFSPRLRSLQAKTVRGVRHREFEESRSKAGDPILHGLDMESDELIQVFGFL